MGELFIISKNWLTLRGAILLELSKTPDDKASELQKVKDMVTTAMSGDSFGFYTWGEGGWYWHLPSGGQQCC